ncbi:MAG: GAF domain-containing protein [Chloroflexales bacterium]
MQELRQSAEPVSLPKSDMLALILWPYEDAPLRAELTLAGVAVSFAPTLEIFIAAQGNLQPEVLLIDPEMVDEFNPFPRNSQVPLIMVPSAARGEPDQPLPTWLSTSLGLAINRARSSRATQHTHAIEQQLTFELQMVAGMCMRISTAPTPSEAIHQLMVLIRDRFSVEAGTLFRYERSADCLIFDIAFGTHQELLEHTAMPSDQGIAGWVIQHGESVIIPDVQRDARFNPLYDQHTGFQTRSIICVPLWAGGKPWGVIQLINKLGEDFTAIDLMVLRGIASIGYLGKALEQYDAGLHAVS